MHVDAVGAFLIVIANAVFWSLIFLGRSFTSLARSYFGWALFITLWSFGYGITLSGLLPYEPTLIWNKYCQAMAMMIGPFFFKFSCDVAGSFSENKNFFKFYLCFGIINAVALFFTPYYVKGLWSFGSYTYQPLGGPLYIIFTLFFMWCTLHSYIVVALQYKKAMGLRKTHIKLFLIATGVAYFGGVTLFFQGFKLPVPTTGVYLILAYVLIIGYSIHKYKFLDIESIIKKTLVFAGLSSFVAAFFSIPLFLIPKFLAKSMTDKFQLWLIISVGMAVAGLVGPLNRILVNVTDKYLFQKKQEIKVILKNLSEKVSTILDLKQIGQTILSTLQEAFRLESGMIFVRDKKTEKYHLLEYFGLQPKEFANSVKTYFEKSVINGYFLSRQSTLTLDHPDSAELPADVKNWLGMAKVRVCVPLVIDKDLNGVLVLGKKKSDQEFSQEEIDYFPTIESQVSLAIQKATLLETVVEERAAKVRAEHLAKRVEFAGLIKHEIQNKLVHIQTPANTTASYCVPRLRKWHKEQDEERFSEMCDEIIKNSKNINFAVEHISIIAQTARGGVDEMDNSVQESDPQLAGIHLKRNRFHGDWHYAIHPKPSRK